MEVGPSAAPIIPMEAASFKSKPMSAAAQMAKENTELGGSSEEEHNGLGEERPEVDHGADTDKQ